MNMLVSLGSKIWFATPFPAVRQFYWWMFLKLVRNRRTIAAPVDGLTYELDLNEMIDVQLFLGRFEPDMIAAIGQYCRPGSIVFDIGANIGAHTLRFARAVGPSGRVYAFEPTEFAYAKLVRNLALNAFTNVSTVHLALSDHQAKAETVDFRASWRTDRGRADRPSVVDFDTLDEWCARTGVGHVDLIKLDVDGNEFSILDGGRRTLERWRPVLLMEAGPYHLEEPKRNPFRLLDGLGYSFRAARSGEPFGTLAALEARLAALAPAGVDSINLIVEPRR